MAALLKQAVAGVSEFPESVQDEYAELLLRLVGADEPPTELSDEEDADRAEAENEAARGELASDEEIAALWATSRA